ncbi:hypothetical protein Slin15195_G130170 [Septoria linicola]|uniref:Uncharacterized protein n=1 Tax=Septoria linicola TaxID=215465 RepID=A0A9Q9B982_9PEZI|nr:hypothetical protein Slin14017_G122060 [Septoria linicola]USW59698.1 hypothetical protein Slin15195_G130170 [Septoria linicola]
MASSSDPLSDLMETLKADTERFSLADDTYGPETPKAGVRFESTVGQSPSTTEQFDSPVLVTKASTLGRAGPSSPSAPFPRAPREHALVDAATKPSPQPARSASSKLEQAPSGMSSLSAVRAPSSSARPERPLPQSLAMARGSAFTPTPSRPPQDSASKQRELSFIISRQPGPEVEVVTVPKFEGYYFVDESDQAKAASTSAKDIYLQRRENRKQGREDNTKGIKIVYFSDGVAEKQKGSE